MSLVEQFDRLQQEALTEEDKILLGPLTDFVVLAWDAGYKLDEDLSKASRLEVLARAAAARRRETARIVAEGSAASGPVGMASVLERVDGGQAGAELVAQLGLGVVRAQRGAHG